jgi:hypothetical protein
VEMQGKEFQAPADLRNRPNGLLASLSAGKHKPPAELKNAPGRPLISRYHPELSGGAENTRLIAPVIGSLPGIRRIANNCCEMQRRLAVSHILA